MIILGIESSCDDTSVALVEALTPPSPSPSLGSARDRRRGGTFNVLAEKTASQIDVHKKYGGVVPEVAARCHAEAIVPLIEEVMSEYQKGIIVKQERGSAVTPPSPSPSLGFARDRRRGGIDTFKPDVIAVTSGPGLITSLLVGVEAAKTLAYLWDVPIIGVNHIEGHIHSIELPAISYRQSAIDTRQLAESRKPKTANGCEIEFPALCLVVSGGHTELILMNDHGMYERIGATRDDAAGECFDKVAKLLGLEYPGGPKISKLAAEGNTQAINFPRPMLKENNYDFSFAGLKTAALYWLRDHDWIGDKRHAISDKELKDFCASFELAIVDVLVTKTMHAAEQYKPKSVLLAGGVSANKKIRETLGSTLETTYPTIAYRLSPIKYAMDNGAMIAVAGYYHALKKEFSDWRTLEVNPNWTIDD